MSGKTSKGQGNYMSAFCNNINTPVTKGLKLRYFKNTSNKDSQNVIVDILCTDNTKLSDYVDIKALRGGKINDWSKIDIDLSPIENKTIKAFLITYEGQSKNLECSFDDILLYK